MFGCRCVVASVALVLAVCPDPASASIIELFHEDFNGYDEFPDEFPKHDPINFGVPLVSEGANHDWYAGRFEYPDSPIVSDPIDDILLDVGVQKIPGSGRPSPDPVGRVADDAGLLFKISTTGYHHVQMHFDHRMFKASSYDKLVVGYTTLDLDPFFGTERVADFFNDPAAGDGNQSDAVAWWDDNWTEVFRKNRGNKWKSAWVDLPDDTPEIWVAFWLDNGDKDFAKIDNVWIKGKEIPEPGSLVLIGLGAAMTLRLRRRR